MELKILSWNIWYDGNFNEISKFLIEFNADIIGLQEVVLDDPTRDIVGFLKKLGYQYAIAPVRTIKKDGRTMSNAIFSKYPIVDNKTYLLSENDIRNALRVDVKIGEKILSVFCTHLLHTHQQVSDIQELQIKNLIKVIKNKNTVVMGDFNSTTESVTIQKMREIMIDSNPSAIPTINPDFFDCSKCDPKVISSTRLDYIFTSKDIKINSFKVHNVSGSDHLPISVIIEVQKKEKEG